MFYQNSFNAKIVNHDLSFNFVIKKFTISTQYVPWPGVRIVVGGVTMYFRQLANVTKILRTNWQTMVSLLWFATGEGGTPGKLFVRQGSLLED